MEKEFVTYELALRMKALGFNEPCLGSYYSDSEENFKEGAFDYRRQLNIEYSIYSENTYYILAPTWQQAFRWFRQEHNLKFHIREDVWNNWCSLKMIRHDDYISIGEYKTYEESELACLKKLIEIIESK
jgi:hypothetical protein